MSILKTHIQNLHTFSVPTCLTEVGCGLALSNLLYSENNASHTVYDVYSPYNRKAQLKIDKRIALHRAVSMENTMYLMLASLKDTEPEEGETKETILHYVANFQIGGNITPKTTHGYIMIGDEESKLICYHVTIPGEDTRENLLNKISEIGFSLLYNKQLELTGNDGDYLPINYVDQVLIPFIDNEGDVHDQLVILSEINDEIVVTNNSVDILLDLFLGSKIPEGEDNLLCYHNREFVRFEDFFRDKKKVMIYRGTFNPITKAHVNLFEKAVEQEEPDFHALMIARSIYTKPDLSKIEIKERMAYADALGIPLIIGHSFLYVDTIKHLRKRMFDNCDTELQFIMGADTIQRVFEVEPDEFFIQPIYKNVSYVYVKRIGFNISEEYQKIIDLNDKDYLKFKLVKNFNEEDYIISATQARQLLKDGDFLELGKLLPKSIFDIFESNNKDVLK